MLGNGRWSDFIDLWLDYTASSQSPQQFRLWTGLSLIGAALERRVWAKTGRYITYPNLYVMLVGAPGVGKQVIEDARTIYRSILNEQSKPTFYTASDSVTRASLIDELSKARRTFLPPEGKAIDFHCMTVFSEEFRVLLPAYDQDFISRLDRIYNGPPDHEESRRTGPVKEVRIINPLLNLLAGVQPAYLANTFPDDAWATGICRRLIMVYSAEGTDISIFTEQQELEDHRKELQHHLKVMALLFGHAKWTAEAASLMRDFEADSWAKRQGQQSPLPDGGWPLPDHSRLVHYNRSRMMLLIKLSIIAAVSQRAELVIRLPDVQRALGWLISAESLMPDIFQEMKGKNDREVMEEAHRFIVQAWSRGRSKPIRGQLISDFLSQRLPSEKVDRVWLLMERSDMIARVAGTDNMWVPRPKSSSGLNPTEH